MVKWLKRIVLLTALVLLVFLGFSLWSWHLLRGTPDWYHPPELSVEEREAAANRADQRILDTLSWASEVQAQQTRQRVGGSAATSRPTTAPLKTISFSEAELNAFFQKWNRANNWEAVYGTYMTDPVMVIHEGRIIIAGKMKEIGTVASIHFEPSIDENGKFHLKMARMLGGRLPLPTSMFSKYRTRMINGLQRRLPAWQQQAQIDSAGANSPAVYAGMSKMFLRTLNDQPAEPTIFLPTTGSAKIPVRLKEVHVEDKTLTLSVEPLDASERSNLLERLRKPYGTEMAATNGRE